MRQATIRRRGSWVRPAFAVVTAVATLSIATVQAAPGDCLGDDEARLLELIDAYRVENGLPPIPWSVSLSAVGQWHAWDWINNPPATGVCNLHSWSDAMPDLWTGMCYTPDHAQAALMWSKPREITDDVYTGSGFEIPAVGYQTPEQALDAWKQSPGHNDVILNAGIWSNAPYNPWPAVGVGVDPVDKVYFVWFGNTPDPQGTIISCAAANSPGAVDPDTGPLRLARSATVPGDLSLAWGASTCVPGPTDYAVHAGSLGQFTSHAAVACTTGGLTDVRITPRADSEYYIVVPLTHDAEGSYGRDSDGRERPGAAGACRPVQNLATCNPG